MYSIVELNDNHSSIGNVLAVSQGIAALNSKRMPDAITSLIQVTAYEVVLIFRQYMVFPPLPMPYCEPTLSN